MKNITVSEGEYSECAYQALRWAGIHQLWNELSMDEYFEPMSDILKHCDNGEIENTYEDNGHPYHSVDCYEFITSAPDKLRAEIYDLFISLVISIREHIDHELIDETPLEKLSETLRDYVNVNELTPLEEFRNAVESGKASKEVVEALLAENEVKPRGPDLVEDVMKTHGLTREQALDEIEKFGG